MSLSKIKEHLICNGIDKSYVVWYFHGESCPLFENYVEEENRKDHHVNDYDGTSVSQIVEDVGNEFMGDTGLFESLVVDAKKPIYPNCEKFTKLSTLIRLFNIKEKHGLSDMCFKDLLAFLQELLPENNEIPSTINDAKKTIRALGVGYEKIHACPNYCILYRNEFKDEQECPVCDESRWKKKKKTEEVMKGIPAKVLWYLPIIPRFIRLFQNPIHAKKLTWHSDERVEDGKLRHPADSPAWKKLDSMWPDFHREARNLRLGLSADGINPYSSQSSKYSCWPVIIVIYNLPPWLCMKRKYMFLSLLIPGSKQPGNDIDVYLAPLIDDLKTLWSSGVEVFDGFRREKFMLRAALLWTISDFPAYGNLSGCSVKGYDGCPICEENTFSQYLKHSKKVVYMGHRRFLPRNHVYRRWKKAFNGAQQFDTAPEPLSGAAIEFKLSRIQFGPFGKIKKKKTKKKNSSASKKRRRSPITVIKSTCWKKKSIFFQLDYWKHLLIRHTLDVMHIEKNVCESIIGTLLNISGKTKDGVSSRMDLVEMGIKGELAPRVEGKRTYLPPSCYILTKDERRKFCETLSNIKVPESFSANICNYVLVDEVKLGGLKSHDYHILMQYFLPVAIQTILPSTVREAITRFSIFFNLLCCKVVDVSILDTLQSDIVLTLCLFEQYFPPSFFDIMIHLTIHLVREVKLCGPVYLRWMYPFERFMKVLKGYVRNHYRPEASIVERYVTEEATEFCSEYLLDLESIRLRRDPKQILSISKGLNSGNVYCVQTNLLNLAHRNILENTNEVQPFIQQHINWLTSKWKSTRPKRIQDEHHRTFVDWFRKKIADDVRKRFNVSNTLYYISSGPSLLVIKHSSYFINGYQFSTEERDSTKTTQSSGVSLVAQTMQFSSAKDSNPIYSDMIFYGIIQEIWEIDYVSFRIPMFLCDWIESTSGVKADANGFTFVNLTRLGHKTEPFIMATQAKQVFYVKSEEDDVWARVFATQSKEYTKEIHDEDENELLLEQLTPVKGFTSTLIDTHYSEETFSCTRHDGERVWVDN